MINKTLYVSELKEGQNIEDIFVLVEAKYAQSKNGPFWDLKLQDRTGLIEAKIWYPQSNDYPELFSEKLVLVQAQVRSFRERLQLVVKYLKILDDKQFDLDWSLFIPCSARPPEELLMELEDLCKKELTYAPWKRFCKHVLKDPEIRQKLLYAPAAKSIHHAYMGGLLEHTLDVAKACLSISSIYPQLDREILLVAAVFHDIGKAWELECGVSRKYTDEGRLLGHIILGIQILEPFLQKAKDLDQRLILHLKHLILSHHGEYDFGSPKRPKTSEALVLHFIDNMDAKINNATQALSEIEEGVEHWTSYLYSLERQLYRPASTSQFQKANETGGKSFTQCLLPLKE